MWLCRLVTLFDSPPMPWALPFYAEAIALATAEEVSPLAAPKRRRLHLKYMDVEAVEDSHGSETEEDYSSDALSAADIVGSNWG